MRVAACFAAGLGLFGLGFGQSVPTWSMAEAWSFAAGRRPLAITAVVNRTVAGRPNLFGARGLSLNGISFAGATEAGVGSQSVAGGIGCELLFAPAKSSVFGDLWAGAAYLQTAPDRGIRGVLGAGIGIRF